MKFHDHLFVTIMHLILLMIEAKLTSKIYNNSHYDVVLNFNKWCSTKENKEKEEQNYPLMSQCKWVIVGVTYLSVWPCKVTDDHFPLQLCFCIKISAVKISGGNTSA